MVSILDGGCISILAERLALEPRRSADDDRFHDLSPIVGGAGRSANWEQEVTWHEKLEVPRSVSRRLIMRFDFTIVEQQEGPLLSTPDVQQVACLLVPYPLGR